MSKSELKPCPFCGSDDVTVDGHTEFIGVAAKYEQVVCEKCGCQTGVSPNAVRDWNTRQPDKELIVALEAIVEVAEKQTFDDTMNNPCGAHDAMTEIESLADEALAKYKG